MKPYPLITAGACLLLVTLCAASAPACGPEFAFRSYLNSRFWQPLSKYEQSLDAAPGAETVASPQRGHAFAGTASEPASPGLMGVRADFRAGALDKAEAGIGGALGSAATEAEREELQLIGLKILLRKGEQGDRDPVLLRGAKEKLLAYLQTARTPAWRSEARGWLARCHFLLEEYAPAAKIYLDELRSNDTVHSRQSLISSLRLLFPYNGSSARLAEHLEEYFDTPEHALFVVNIVTNPVYSDDEERRGMAEVAQRVIRSLQQHRELFRGPLADQLGLALMRASLYRGDTGAALAYSRLIGPAGAVAGSPEFNWMVASCRFLRREYAEAVAPLQSILASPRATLRERNAAAQGLVGVYQKTGRRVDQLHAAFIYETLPYTPGHYEESRTGNGGEAYTGFTYWPMGGELLDLPYLLDVQLSDDDLRQYLEMFGNESRQLKLSLRRPRTAHEVVQYALAVRYARQEKYDRAGELFAGIDARPRAERMKELAPLAAAAADTALPKDKRLRARFAYASYLADHSTQVFFNDMLWTGFQTWAFLSPEGDPGLTRRERESFLRQERTLKDEQEERWRAYRLLAGVAREGAGSELGKRAARKAISCLELINTGRFGRKREIRGELAKMKGLLGG